MTNAGMESLPANSLVGLVLWGPPRGAEDPVFDSRLPRRDFSGLSHTSAFKLGTPVLPGAWCYRVSAGTGWPGINIP